ncbi:MAG: response regulator [Candidatus Acidiferrales bacterium]
MPRILVADDNTNIQKMVVLAFQERGIDVIAVGNGEAAVRRLPDLNPDIVLADVFMPVRNGYEVCEFVKKDSRFAHVPVILLVGAFDPLDEKEARRVGADGVLKKPFVPPDPLIAMVTSALEKNPKLAAELARAKETPPEPPMPAALEAPIKREPAPLPDFPEPTPEEAAQIYGFGKGVRTFDEIEETAKDLKTPVVDEDKDDEEEFDGASTSRDWRRTAGMDLEIPEGTTDTQSYSFGRDVSPITFPSEKDVPPRHIPVKEGEEEAVAQNSAIAPAKEEAAPAAPAWKYTPAPEPEPVREIAAAPEIIEAPLVEAAKESEKEPAHSFGASPELEPGRSSTEWMEMMAPPPSEYPAGGWMSEERAEDAHVPASSSATPVVAEAAPAPATAASTEPETPLFTEEPKASEAWFSVPPPIRDTILETVHEAAQEASVEPASRPAPDFGHEILVAPADADRSYDQPANDSAPPAIERIFSEDQPREFFERTSHPKETAPPEQHYFPPAEEDFAEERAGNSKSSSGDSAEFNERIPTAPPPNREALADIPFLMPPAAASFDSGAVDAVVQKVLERLEPQLHDLLSKGVLKPLIENLLQQELANKGK